MNIIPMFGISEPFSSLSHLLMVFVALFYGIKLISLTRDQPVLTAAVGVFMFSVIFLLTMSGVFHFLDYESYSRAVLQRLDHAGIFVLIAGTFTPIHCILFKGFWRWGFLLLIWVLAIAGITLKTLFFNELPEWLGLAFYLSLGWLGILSAYLTHQLHGFKIIKPLLYGALAYTIGACLEFFRLPIVISGVIGPHELFHIAVLVGISWHWQFIRNLLITRKIIEDSSN